MITSLAPKSNQSGRLTMSGSIFYVLPFVFVTWINAPIHILQGVFAKYYGVSLAVLGSILLFVRCFDAVSDVLMGQFADHYQRRYGTRKPLFAAGGLLLFVAAYLLFVPVGAEVRLEGAGSPQSGASISVAYMVACYLLYYIALTMVEISHQAWASDIAATSEAKSRIFSIRSMALYVGLVLFYMVPQLPIFETSDITPEVLKVSILTAGLLLLPALYLCVTKAPDADRPVGNVPQEKREWHNAGQRLAVWRNNVKGLLKNRPLCLFFSFYLLLGVGAGLWYGVVFLYVDSYLGMGESFASMFMMAFVLSALVAPIWYKLSLIVGKKAVVALAMLLYAASYLYTASLTPGDTTYSELVFLKVLNSLGNGCFGAMAPAMLSEVVDYTNWKNRRQNTAIYFSLYLFFSKIGMAAGAGLSLAILGWYGYDAAASTQTDEATTGLMIAMVWLPVSLVALSLLPVLASPITERRHQIIRRRLDALSARASKILPAGKDGHVGLSSTTE